MKMENLSGMKVFSLSGLNETWQIRSLLFFLTLLVYILILFVNVMLIFTITLEKALHEPMYIFLCNMCVNTLYGTAGFYPKFLYDVLSGSHMISYQGCFLQIFVIYTSLQCEFLTLTVMAYDRYVAICKPLIYHSIMSSKLMSKLVTVCWIFPFLIMSFMLILLARLTLCRSHIDKFYCENVAIAKLSCESIVVQTVMGLIVMIIFGGFGILTMLSYTKLIYVATKSKEDRIKFMQTCVPHILALINFTVAVFFDPLYNRFGSTNMLRGARNFLALQLLIIPPLFNPIIYGLKLTEIRKRLLKQCHSFK